MRPLFAWVLCFLSMLIHGWLAVPVHCTCVFVCVLGIRADLLLAGAECCSSLTSAGPPDAAASNIE